MSFIIEPNIHPVFVHFAYALTVTGAISLLISRVLGGARRDSLKIAADWMMAFGALAIIATAAAGFQAYNTVAHDEPAHVVMTTHRNWAVATAIVILALSAWRWMRRKDNPSILFALLYVAAAVSLSVTAWWGGQLVYGHGLGVKSLPAAEEEDHHHHHGSGDVEGHDDDPMTSDHEDADHHDGDSHMDDADEPHHGAAAAVEAGYPETPDAVVDAFAAALHSGDDGAVRRLLEPDVIIAEAGGAERSLEEYADHHMPADMAFVGAVEQTVQDRKALVGPELASVVSESTMHGDYEGKHVNLRSMETMVLRLDDGHWRIAHIHWSSAPIAGDHEH